MGVRIKSVWVSLQLIYSQLSQFCERQNTTGCEATGTSLQKLTGVVFSGIRQSRVYWLPAHPPSFSSQITLSGQASPTLPRRRMRYGLPCICLLPKIQTKTCRGLQVRFHTSPILVNNCGPIFLFFTQFGLSGRRSETFE